MWVVSEADLAMRFVEYDADNPLDQEEGAEPDGAKFT
jgi:hypothetical protein